MKPEIRFKTLPEDRTPHGHKYRLNKWYKIDDDLMICERGLHCSKNLVDAMGYVAPGYVAKVEVRGKSIVEDDKEAWEEMRIVKWKKWTNKHSVSLAIYAAELVLDNYEEEYPDDDRPRKAIEAAKTVLRSNTDKNRSAAWSARSAAQFAARSAARSAAWSARSAAWSAAWSARSAAWSTRFAAWSAAWSAARSARSAQSAARSTRSAAEIKSKLHKKALEISGLEAK